MRTACASHQKAFVAAFAAMALLRGHLLAATVEEVQIVKFGTFERAVPGATANPDTIRGSAPASSGVTLLESTTNIHAHVGTSFGLLIKVMGGPVGAIVPITVRCRHPKQTDPVSGHSSEVDGWENTFTIGVEGSIGFTFENSWELAPGAWTFQIFSGSKLMAEKTFKVIVVSTH